MRAARRVVAAGAIVCAVNAALADVKTFQNGTLMSDGLLYWGTQDVTLTQAGRSDINGNVSPLLMDLQDVSNTAGTEMQSLLKFNGIFGSLPNQVPLGSTITSVSLTFNTSNTSTHASSIFRMSTQWNEQSTWTTHGPVSGGSADATITPNASGATVISTPGLVTTVQAWSNGARNEGWSLRASGTDGWDVSSSESGTTANRPKLSITYTPPAVVPAPRPKNVILFVGDGMGLEAIKAAKLKTFGNTTGKFAFEFDKAGLMTHDNASQALTDSAASATAMATGVKVANENVSQAADGSPLKSVTEIMKERGKRVGLVTTGTGITDATPAAFGAHEPDRDNGTAIANDFINGSQPNVLFGQPGSMPSNPAGYTTITTQSQLQNLNTNLAKVSGQFAGVNSTTGPSLSLMATKAMEILSNDPDGFFLLVENEDTDVGGHSNNITTTINGVQSLSAAVENTIAWLMANGELDETLIVVLADHETGGLTVTGGNGIGNNPSVTWSTTGHTQTPIGVWAMGPGAELIDNTTIDNTDVFRILTVPEPSGLLWLAAGAAFLRRRRR